MKKGESNKLSIALFEPRIPQNTGNIARTCAAFNIPLHIIEPFGFSLNSKLLKRAGLDYWPYMDISIHKNMQEFIKTLNNGERLLGFSKSASKPLARVDFLNKDVLIFGREDTGLPDFVRSKCNQIASIPMPGGVVENESIGVRSLNLANSVAIVAYQAILKLDGFNNS